jgi:hypothetical protein
MKPYDQNIVTYESMLIGYTDAVARFETVVEDRNPITAFVALFESLNWAVALDDRIGKHLGPVRRVPGPGVARPAEPGGRDHGRCPLRP